MKEQSYVVIDSSWALLDSGSGKMKATSGVYLENKEFRLLARECDLPASDEYFGQNNLRNTVVLREINTNEILFTQMKFVRPLLKYCPTCGQQIKEEA